MSRTSPSSAYVPARWNSGDTIPIFSPLAAEVADGRAFLVAEDGEEMLRRLRQHGRTGRPLGSPGFVTDLEQRLSRPLSPPETGAEAGKEEIRSMSPEFPDQWFDDVAAVVRQMVS